MKKSIGIMLIATIICTMMFGATITQAKEQFVDGGSSISLAGSVSYDISNVSTLSVGGEIDWFKFNTKNVEGYYTITYKNINIESGWNNRQRLNIELTTLSEAVVKSVDLWENYETSINVKLEKNSTYYFKAYMGDIFADKTGNYSITITFKEDKEADTLAMGASIEPHKVYNASLDGIADVDCYKFVSPITGTYDVAFSNHTIESGWNEGQCPNGYFLSQYEEQLFFAAPGLNSTSYGTVNVEKGKTYYIKFLMGEYRTEHTGNYSFIIGNRCTAVSLSKNKVNMKVGKSVALKATVEPDNAMDKSVVWSSSDESVCTVSESGKVKAIQAGKATITCKSSDKEEVLDTCVVTVKPNAVQIKKITSKRNKGVSIKFKTVKGTTQYEIWYSRKKKGKYTRLTSLYVSDKSGLYTTYSLAQRKKYFIKVRGYAYSAGENIYGKFGKIKSVKVK